MNRLPAEFFRMPPSPRTLSVTRIPRTDGGQTMPVGWNWTNSMFTSVAPACRARECPSPVYSHELEVTLKDLPSPPDGGRLPGDEPPGLAPVAEGTGDAVGVRQQPGDRALHVDVDAERDGAL